MNCYYLKKPPAVFWRSEMGNKMFQNLKMGTKMLPVAEVARDKANTGHVQRTIVSVFCRNYEAQKPFYVSCRSLWKCRTCSRCGVVQSSDDWTHLSCYKKNIYISLAKFTYSFFDACYLSFAQRGLLRLYKNLEAIMLLPCLYLSNLQGYFIYSDCALKRKNIRNSLARKPQVSASSFIENLEIKQILCYF